MTPHLIHTHAGARLESFVDTFTDADGTELALGSYTSTISWERRSDGTTGSFNADSVSGGAVTFTVPEALTQTVDVVDVQVWVGNGTQRLDGKVWRLVVADGPGTAPNI